MKEIKSERAPAAIGPYSQAIRTGNLIFVSGQLPIDPISGNLLKDSIGEQTKLIMNNIDNILKEDGASLKDIVKTTILLTDMGKFGAVNEAYGQFFADTPPARACFQVVALPKGAEIEIEVVSEKQE